MSRRRLSPSDLADGGNERTGNKVGIAIGKGAGRPLNAELSGGPGAKERAALWDGEPPPIDDKWIRRSYDLNKKLADYLSGHMTIKIGSLTARTLHHPLVGKDKKGM